MPKRINLDSTDDRFHGNPEGRFFHGLPRRLGEVHRLPLSPPPIPKNNPNTAAPNIVLDANIHYGYIIPRMKQRESQVAALLPLPPVTFHILMALAGQDRHGYAIIQEVEARTDGAVRIGAGTLYRSIQRMLEQGLIIETRDRPTPELDDERRRYYRITPFGSESGEGRNPTPGADAEARPGAGICPGEGVMRLYEFLLHLYPAAFRIEYGDELRQVFAARRAEASGGGGVVLLLGFRMVSSQRCSLLVAAPNLGGLVESRHATRPTGPRFQVSRRSRTIPCPSAPCQRPGLFGQYQRGRRDLAAGIPQ